MEKHYCFYHNDMDGKAAAWIVHRYVENHCDYPDRPIFYQRHSYGDKWKIGYIDNNTTVFIVDLSFTTDTKGTLLSICDKAKKVIWIDHHQSSIDFFKADTDVYKIENLETFLYTEGCGALLTHIYLNSLSVKWIREKDYAPFSINLTKDTHRNTMMAVLTNFQNHGFGIDVPDWLVYLDDFDRWQNKYDNTNYFILGCDAHNTGLSFKDKNSDAIIFNEAFWKSLDVPGFTNGLIDAGYTIWKYMKRKYDCELSQCFPVQLMSKYWILCKNGTGNSWNFGDQIKEWSAVCLFHYDGKSKLWHYSVYSDEKSDFDCAKFCERYGGGGHKHAAGFQVEGLIFTDLYNDMSSNPGPK